MVLSFKHEYPLHEELFLYLEECMFLQHLVTHNINYIEQKDAFLIAIARWYI